MKRILIEDKERLIQLTYTGVTEEKLSLIAEHKDLFTPYVVEIVDKLYSRITKIENLRQIIKNFSLANLKKTQAHYLHSCLQAIIDENYINNRIKIGHIHSNIGLDIQWYLSTYEQYVDIISDYINNLVPDKALELISAFSTLFSFDTQLTLEAYKQIEVHRATNPIHYEMERLRKVSGLTDEDLDNLDQFIGLISFQIPSIMKAFLKAINKRSQQLDFQMASLIHSNNFFHDMERFLLQFTQEKIYRKPEVFHRLSQDWSRLIIQNKLPISFFSVSAECLEEAIHDVFTKKSEFNGIQIVSFIVSFNRLVKFMLKTINELIHPYMLLRDFQFLNIYSYEISTSDFGKITWMDERLKLLLKHRNAEKKLSRYNNRCYEVIFNRSLPCPNCPITDKSQQSITMEMKNTEIPSFYKISPFNTNSVFDLSRSLLVMQDATKESTMMFETIDRLLQLAEYRDDDTGHHVERIGILAGVLAKLVGKDETFIEQITLAAKFHDIGKVGIPDSILNKPGKLNENEWESMKTHAIIGYQILNNLEFPVIQMAATIAFTHHEWYDGTGYPNQLKGEEIPLEGRIVAIVDVFDALLSKRVYKDAFTPEKVKEIMINGKGKQFDPKLIDLLLDMWDEFLDIRSQHQIF